MPKEPEAWQRICSISFNSPWQKVPRYHGDGLSTDKHRTWVWVVCIVRKLASLHPSTLPPPSSARISIQSGLLPLPGQAHLKATQRHFPNWLPTRQGRVATSGCCFSLLPLTWKSLDSPSTHVLAWIHMDTAQSLPGVGYPLRILFHSCQTDQASYKTTD